MKAQPQPLAPYLICRGAAQAIEFYRKVFGAEEVFRLVDPGDKKVGHAELSIAGSKFLVADEYPAFGALSPTSIGGSPVSLQLYVNDVDAVIASAERHGATVLRPVKDEFFGDRVGMVADPFGHKWHIATRKAEVSPEEMQRLWNARFR